MTFSVSSLLSLVVVILVARLMGKLFAQFHQPAVMGEVFGGILLGPSVLGYFFPGVTGFLFHPEDLSFLKHIAELGILLYLFTIGLEVDLPRLKKSVSSAFIISALSMLLPFILGSLLALRIFSDYAPAGIGPLVFSIFIGAALSITAFPVLARILSESPLHKTALGDLALTCSALNDMTAWCLVAVITGILQSNTLGAGLTLLLTVFYVALMFFLVRPFILKKSAAPSKNSMAFFIIAALASSVTTELIGIHGLFGAFLFGAVVPSDSVVAEEITEKLQNFLRILFLPAFFAITGMKTQIGLLSSAQDWTLCGAIILLAIAGKFGGAFSGALLAGHSRRESSILGVLMNTRGLVELIILNIGLSLGVITPVLFTMMVIMALVTTYMTGPLLRILLKDRKYGN